MKRYTLYIILVYQRENKKEERFISLRSYNENKDRGEETIYAGTWALRKKDSMYQGAAAGGGSEGSRRNSRGSRILLWRSELAVPPIWEWESKQLASPACLCVSEERRGKPPRHTSYPWRPYRVPKLVLLCQSEITSSETQRALWQVNSFLNVPENNPLETAGQTFYWMKKQVEKAGPTGASKGLAKSPLPRVNSASSHITRRVSCGFSSNIRN